MIKTFASDNYAPVHTRILQALIDANAGHAPSYGADEITARTIEKFKSLFTPQTEVFFVYNGTAANVLGLSAMTQSYHAIICSELAHIQVDESTAPEKFTHCKILTVPTHNGKIYPAEVEKKIIRQGDQHHPQCRVISISQPTEYGTVYEVNEIKSLHEIAEQYGLLMHMDGSRIANAAVSLQKDFSEFTCQAGVDVLSFGGTKNGMMFGEAVLFFNPSLTNHFSYLRKQGMQLHSKMRFISAQFEALLKDELWKQNATHANDMAQRLEKNLLDINGIQITQSVEANALFVILPQKVVPILQQKSFFYMWNEALSEARLMCSFDTTPDEIDDFTNTLKQLLKKP